MVRSHFNLDDEIFRVSLDSLAHLPESPVVVGGVAIQLHAKDRVESLRNTPDVDLIIRRNLADYIEFTGAFFMPALRFLNSRGYVAQSKKGRLNNAIKVIKNPNKPDEKNFLINLTYFDSGVYSCFSDYVSQQIDNSQKIVYDENGQFVSVASLEEVLPLKIQRANRYGVQREGVVGIVYPTIVDQAKRGDWESLASMPLEEWKVTLSRLQEKIDFSKGRCPEEKNTYKLSKDVYDICLAARCISDSPSIFNNDRYEHNIHRIVERACPKHSLSE